MEHQDEDLRQYQRERDEAVVKEKVLEKKVQELEVEAESRTSAKEDKARHIKIMEVRLFNRKYNNNPKLTIYIRRVLYSLSPKPFTCCCLGFVGEDQSAGDEPG